jgi:hypothetical protein
LLELADTAARVGPWLVQVGLGLAWAVLFLLAESEPRLELALADAVAFVVGVPPGLALGLTLALGLVLALAEALALALAVLVLLWLRLDDVAGAVVVVVVRPGEPVLVSATAGCVDDGAQGLCEVCPATPGFVGPVPSAAEGIGVVLCFSVAPAPLEELPVMAELRSLVTCSSPWRAGGTTARTKPRANTAAPTPKAGRSIASRQSLGRFGSRRCGARRTPSRRTRAVVKPTMAAQTPSKPLGWLAWAGRDWILARIRSRPSAPGST